MHKPLTCAQWRRNKIQIQDPSGLHRLNLLLTASAAEASRHRGSILWVIISAKVWTQRGLEVEAGAGGRGRGRVSKGGGKFCCCATGRRGARAGCSPLAGSGASPVKQRDPIGSPPRLASQSSIAQLNHSIETRPASDGMNRNFRQLCSSPSASNFALLPAELFSRFNAVSQTFSALSFLFITALKRKKKSVLAQWEASAFPFIPLIYGSPSL